MINRCDIYIFQSKHIHGVQTLYIPSSHSANNYIADTGDENGL